MERKRLEELEDALKNADEQIKNFRVSTKRVAADLLNQHRITAQPAKARTDGIDPSKVAENSRKKLIVSFEHRLNNLRVRLSQTDNQNKNLKKRGYFLFFVRNFFTRPRLYFIVLARFISFFDSSLCVNGVPFVILFDGLYISFLYLYPTSPL